MDPNVLTSYTTVLEETNASAAADLVTLKSAQAALAILEQQDAALQDQIARAKAAIEAAQAAVDASQAALTQAKAALVKAALNGVALATPEA